MTNAFSKEIARSIKQSAGRFVAIAIISFLGAGFYGGLRMSSPDMRIAGDEFFDATCFYDIRVVSTLGLDDESIELIRNVEGVETVMPAYSANAMALTKNGSYATAFESVPIESARASNTSDGVHALSDDPMYLNRPILVQGAWPASEGQCVVGETAATSLGIEIGDTLTLIKGEQALEDTFTVDSFVVSGLVNSPAYVASSQYGPTSLGTGDIELFAYVPEESFVKSLPYTTAYAIVAGARACTWGFSDYDAVVEPVRERIAAHADEIADARWHAVKQDLSHEITGQILQLTVDMGWADDVDKGKVFVLGRSKNSGAASLESDAEGIAQIATMVPFMFFLVAALVSLTSMTRMVDEERMTIGTHKALGYSKSKITSKYLIYGGLASALGSILGVVALGKGLPLFIMMAYGISYDVPVYPTPLEFVTTAKAIGLSVGVTMAATWFAAASNLRARPAALMLPPVPKSGKRIILERITPLWRRLSFSQKVTARNLLRYKRRFFMAVVGVTGCTALLMIGFGLRDAIGGIVSNQYEELITYDMVVRLDDDADANARKYVRGLLGDAAVDQWIEVADITMIAQVASEDDQRINVVVPRNPAQMEQFVVMRDRVTGEQFAAGDDLAIITEKAATVLGVSAGAEAVLYDENEVGDPEGDPHAVHISGVAENYLGHYLYLAPDVYRAAVGEDPSYDCYYVVLADGADGKELAETLISLEEVNTVSFVADKVATYEDMLDVMNKLIYIIVLAAAALAFVVLYNLTNINISERVREIATLKVLGFTRVEVNAYIFREVLIMALIGALVGCILGVPLTTYIAIAAETPLMMFGRTVEPVSFVISLALTIAFAAFVCATMRKKLANVSMVESLKSVE